MPLPTGNDLYDVAYANGQFVAVGNLGTIITSADGLTWVVRNSGTRIDSMRLPTATASL
jgi:hypothetical protein